MRIRFVLVHIPNDTVRAERGFPFSLPQIDKSSATQDFKKGGYMVLQTKISQVVLVLVSKTLLKQKLNQKILQ